MQPAKLDTRLFRNFSEEKFSRIRTNFHSILPLSRHFPITFVVKVTRIINNGRTNMTPFKTLFNWTNFSSLGLVTAQMIGNLRHRYRCHPTRLSSRPSQRINLSFAR